MFFQHNLILTKLYTESNFVTKENFIYMCVSERYFMSVNSFTLNNLYNQGILDYVPFELCNGSNVSLMNGMQNPYLQSAQQGALYQNHGQQGDKVELGGVNNGFGLEGVGSQSNAGADAWGLNGVGTYSSAGGANAWGGFGDVNNGFNKTISTIERTPNFVKGLAAGALMIGAVALSLRRGKKPPVEMQSFFAKLNPFKKKNT